MRRLSYTAMVLPLLLVMLVSGCATTSAYREINMADAPELAATTAPVESGKIAFTRELGFFEKLFAKKEPQPTLAANDIAITGKRTSSTAPKKTESSSTFIKVLDSLIREEAWSYKWQGTAKTDGIQIPLVLNMRVTNGFSGKYYNLTSAYSRLHEKPQGFKAHLKNLIGADTSAKLTMEKRITGEETVVPFEVARLTAGDGSVYCVQATRMFASAEDSPKPTRRSLIFARDQRYRIAADATVYADCTLDNFTLYADAIVDESRRTSIKECIGLFCAFLWSLEEHESSGAMLE